MSSFDEAQRLHRDVRERLGNSFYEFLADTDWVERLKALALKCSAEGLSDSAEMLKQDAKDVANATEVSDHPSATTGGHQS